MGKLIFTEEQDRFIFENYKSMSTKEIAGILNFKIEQIRGRANYLGIVKDSQGIFTEEEKQFIIDNYPTMTAEEMKKALGKTANQIRGYASSKGLKKEKQYKKYNDEEKQYILENYNIVPTGEIAKYIGVTTKQINDFGYHNGLLRDIEHFQVNENYFEVIDNEHKAYWLGFLYADGCISESKRKDYVKSLTMELTLCSEDKSHLEKFNKDLESDYKITDKVIKKKYFANRLSISNTNFCRHLIDKGCVQRKSLILTFPTSKIVPNHLIHHFIRGYFDGDGCIHISGDKQRHSVSFVGTKDFLFKIQKVLNKNIGLTMTKLNQKSGQEAFQIQWGGKNNVKKFYKYLYKDATIWLDRKYNKFQEVN